MGKSRKVTANGNKRDEILKTASTVLEVAKLIYGSTGNEAMECESLILLSEVNLENSFFIQAAKELRICRDKRLKTLPADSRTITTQRRVGRMPFMSWSRGWRT